MECSEPGTIRDEELWAYLAGELVRPTVQRHLAQEKKLGPREPAIPERMGFHPGCRRSPAARSRTGIHESHRGSQRDRWLLDQPAFHVHGEMAPAFLLPELEPAAFPAFVRPLREIDRRGHPQRR